MWLPVRPQLCRWLARGASLILKQVYDRTLGNDLLLHPLVRSVVGGPQPVSLT